LEATSDQEIRGLGQTVNISSTGVLFTTSDELRVGRSVELSIEWPLLRCGSAPVTLTVAGVLVRTDTGVAAIEVKRRKFHTDPLFALSARTDRAAEWLM